MIKTITICDRCGKECKNVGWHSVKYHRDIYGIQLIEDALFVTKIHFCPECAMKFEKFLANE